jgi:type II secretory pathway pseudopilin PulG
MEAPFRNTRTSEAGTTLVEVLVAMIILGIVSTMLITGWISLQRASAFTVADNNARAEARDGLSRMTVELRDAQPTSLPTSTASPTATPMPSPTWDIYTVAGPWEVDFYSQYNQPGAGTDGTGAAGAYLKLTRIYLDTSGATAQKTLYWQRDTNGISGFDSGDRTFVLARNVVNKSIPSTSTPTAIFTYGYRDPDSGQYLTTDNADGSLDLSQVISVQIRLITDINLAHTPKYIDLSTTVRPRNASTN